MSFVKNSAYLTAAHMVWLISAYVLTVWVGRYLGPEDFGRYIAVVGIFSIINIFLGSQGYAIGKVIAEKDKLADDTTRSIIKIEMPILIIATIIYHFFGAGWIAHLLNDPGLTFNLQLLTPVIIIFGLGAIYGGHFIGKGQFGHITINLIVISIAKIIFLVILTIHYSVEGAIISLSLMGLVGTIYMMLVIRVNPYRKLQYRVKPKLIKIAKLLIPMSGAVFLMTFYMQLGVFVIKSGGGGDALAGFFGAARSILQIPYSLFSNIGLVFLTTVSALYAAKHSKQIRRVISEAFKYILIMVVPALFFVAATADQIILLLYGDEYGPAVELLSILSSGFGFLIVFSLLVMILNAISKPMVNVWIMGLMMLIHFVVGMMLLPSMGGHGVAYSVVISAIVGCLLIVSYAWYKLGVIMNIPSLLKVTGLSVIVYIVLKSLDISSVAEFFVISTLSGLLYIAALFIIRELTKEDILYIKKLVFAKKKKT